MGETTEKQRASLKRKKSYGFKEVVAPHFILKSSVCNANVRMKRKVKRLTRTKIHKLV